MEQDAGATSAEHVAEDTTAPADPETTVADPQKPVSDAKWRIDEWVKKYDLEQIQVYRASLTSIMRD